MERTGVTRPLEGPPLRARELRIAGAGATALALAFMWVVSALVPGVPFPPAAVADLMVRATPGDLSTFFIEILDHWALRLLSLGVLVGTLALGAELLRGTASKDKLRSFPTGGLLALVAVLVSMAAPSEGTNVPATAVMAAIAGLLYGGLARSIYLTSSAQSDWGRRRTLRFGFGGAIAVALGGAVIGWFARSFQGPNRNVRLVAPAPPAVIPEREPFPDIPGLTPEVTSAQDHYVVDIDLVTPSVEAAEWVLEVRGEVDSPIRLTFEELQQRFPIVEEYSTLGCVSNEVGGNLVGNSAWGGVRLADILDVAGVRDGAVDVVFHATDGYSDSITLEAARDPHVILAVSQNRRPLLQEHGFPCRVRVPSIYGMKNVKWLETIEVVNHDYQGYWMMRGWSDEAVVKTESRIDVAGVEQDALVGEETWIAGVAWAGDRGISKVEVTVDGGRTWNEAMLKEAIGPLTWRLWAHRWSPEARGTVTVACRATDGNGDTQTAKSTDPHPDGASGYHRFEVNVS